MPRLLTTFCFSFILLPLALAQEQANRYRLSSASFFDAIIVDGTYLELESAVVVLAKTKTVFVQEGRIVGTINSKDNSRGEKDGLTDNLTNYCEVTLSPHDGDNYYRRLIPPKLLKIGGMLSQRGFSRNKSTYRISWGFADPDILQISCNLSSEDNRIPTVGDLSSILGASFYIDINAEENQKKNIQ
ncbi:MAG: hypothetical protein AB7F43_03110 [Bacteriovoracia bacterium]